jgi:hypothetical protein
METAINTVVPVFALVLCGYLAGRSRFMSEEAIKGLTTFVFYIAIPALLFRTMAKSGPPSGFDFSIVVAYFSGIAVNFALAWAFSRKVFTASIEEAAIMGMGAIFSNTVLLGLPLIYGAFGDEGLVALTLIIAFHSPILMPLVSLVIELGRGSAASLRQKLKLIFFAIFKNPIIVALLAGELYGATGLALPVPVDRFAELLSGAAAPCALFALGASLVGYRLGGDLKQCVALVGFKLLIHPAITALLVFHVFDLQPVWAAVAVVTAALPAGVNVFIMAEHYNIYKARAASAILISTGLSLVTVSILLAFFT